ncbi:MAG: lyase family protein [bacterium]|nr:lyase family protein [bacterium]
MNTSNENLILPGNPRYQPREMTPIFGYDNLYKKVGEVELATLDTLHEIGIISDNDYKKLTPKKRQEILNIKTTEVDKTEREITHHDVRAWVRIAQEILDKKLAKWIHIPLTSYDVIDTARILQFKDAYQIALKPSLKKVVEIFCKLINNFSSQIQIGRTHGQHALPITVGFWLATILDRIINNWESIDFYSNNLSGKISGAVGAHNAQKGLGFSRLCGDNNFEEKLLLKLNLKPAKISTQILPPESLAYFLFSCAMMSATLAQFGRDARHLMRSEIAEVAESFGKNQVGSSTMAHKRNPINFENLEGMWLRTKNEFGKVFDTLISEHQRDLVGSSVARDFPIILINLQQQLNTLLKINNEGITFLERITINKEACQNNFIKSSHLILAEPLYIALQMAGYDGDAHELVNRELMSIAQEKNISLIEALELKSKNDKVLENCINSIPVEIKNLLNHPENYIGDAKEKSLEISNKAKRIILNFKF